MLILKVSICFIAILAAASAQYVIKPVVSPKYSNPQINDGRYYPDDSGAYHPDGSGAYVHDDNPYKHIGGPDGGNNGGNGGFGPGYVPYKERYV